MSIDLSQFLGVFFAEARKLSSELRASVAQMAEPGHDPDALTTAMRAAHSIKGSAAPFGFDSLAAFALRLELTIREMRDGARILDAELLAVLGWACEQLEVMLDTLERGQQVDVSAPEHLETLLGQASPAGNGDGLESDRTPVAAASTSRRWRIDFAPGSFRFSESPQPDTIFAALAELGALEVREDHAAVPHLLDLPLDQCRMGWQLFLHSDAPLEAIEAIVEWIPEPGGVTVAAAEPLSGHQRRVGLQGELCHGKLDGAREQLLAHTGELGEVLVDLGGVAAVDVAGLQVLLAAVEQARLSGAQLRWQSIPEQASVLAGRMGLRGALQW